MNKLAHWLAVVLGVASFPLLLLAIPILRLRRIRILVNPIFSPSFSRIGHLAAEPDCFIKEGILGHRPDYRGLILFPSDRVANRCLLAYWKKHLHVIDSPFWARFLQPLKWVPFVTYRIDPYATAMHEVATVFEIQAKYADQPPLLQLTTDHRAAGEARLRELGIPEGDWYVAVHCREGGFDAHDPVHSARNANIENCFLAMQEIVSREGWCLRMGDPTMKPLPPMTGVIDYAHSTLRSDWMDVFLCARCRFFFGGGSGLSQVATIFGVASAGVNLALPIFGLGFGVKDLAIPKLFWSRSLKRYLTIPETATSPIGSARFTHCYDLQDIEAHENTPEDIRDLVVEMLEEIDGRFVETDEDRRLQAQYHSLLRPGHYAYGGVSRIGRKFLRKYRDLVAPENPPRPSFSYLYKPCHLGTRCYCMKGPLADRPRCVTSSETI
jgi:putative glycosyltransferase (TIGR04372 family)